MMKRDENLKSKSGKRNEFRKKKYEKRLRKEKYLMKVEVTTLMQTLSKQKRSQKDMVPHQVDLLNSLLTSQTKTAMISQESKILVPLRKKLKSLNSSLENMKITLDYLDQVSNRDQILNRSNLKKKKNDQLCLKIRRLEQRLWSILQMKRNSNKKKTEEKLKKSFRKRRKKERFN